MNFRLTTKLASFAGTCRQGCLRALLSGLLAVVVLAQGLEVAQVVVVPTGDVVHVGWTCKTLDELSDVITR